jgi:hypothetical protein
LVAGERARRPERRGEPGSASGSFALLGAVVGLLVIVRGRVLDPAGIFTSRADADLPRLHRLGISRTSSIEHAILELRILHLNIIRQAEAALEVTRGDARWM